MGINIDQIENKALRAVAIKVDDGNNQLDENEFIDFMKTAKKDGNSMSDVMRILSEESLDDEANEMANKLNELEQLENELKKNTATIESNEHEVEDSSTFGVDQGVFSCFLHGMLGTFVGGLTGVAAAKIFQKGKLAIIGMVVGGILNAVRGCSADKKEYIENNQDEINRLNKDTSDTETLNRQLEVRINNLRSEIYGE